MENEVEILEEGTQFYMPDQFTGNTLLFEKGPAGSALIEIIDKNANKILSICMWEKDFDKLKDFLNKK